MNHLLKIFLTSEWQTEFTLEEKAEAINQLESGHILFFPHLAFTLSEQEQHFLTPHSVNPGIKNISFQSKTGILRGALGSATDHQQLKVLLQRYSDHASNLVNALLPRYNANLIMARTSLRPVEISNRKTSYRKDDKRLHVDAFPATPNQGQRILRVFCNINPNGQDRVWRIGEPFEKVAQQFLPKIRRPLPGSAKLMQWLKITKSYRTEYDYLMLQIHNQMKADEHYQRYAKQTEVRFPPGSTWIVQTDHVSHAAMAGQHLLEQTFYLPVTAMLKPELSPIKVLEKLTERVLV